MNYGIPMIGYVGSAGAGKDTAALYLEEHYGMQRYSSGDPIRQVVMEHYLHGYDEERKRWAVYTHAGKASEHPYIRGWFAPAKSGHDAFICFEQQGVPKSVAAGSRYLRLVTIRELMEIVGDQMCAVDPLVLMRPMIPLHAATGKVVIDTSTRGEQQAEFVRAQGGVIVYVHNPAAEAAAGAHHSARFYEHTGHDFRVVNDGGFRHLYNQLDEVVYQLARRAA